MKDHVIHSKNIHGNIESRCHTFNQEIVEIIMKIHVVFVLIAVLTTALNCTPAYCLDAKDIFKIANESVVVIESIDGVGKSTGMGTGFFVGNGDKIVTNAHVVANASQLKCKLASGEEFIITNLSYINFNQDVAILLSPKQAKPLVLSPSDIEVGDNVYVIGNPLGLERTLSTGIVSGRRELNGNNLVQISAPISPGNSGGPVLNSECKVIGMSTFLMKGGQNLNFAVDARTIVKPIEESNNLLVAQAARHAEKPVRQDIPALKIQAAMELVFGNFNIANNHSLWKMTEIWYNDSWVDLGKHNGYSIVYPVKAEKIVEEGSEKVVLFIKITPYLDFDYGRGSMPYLGYIMFSYVGSKWVVESYQFTVGKFGNYGSLPEPFAIKIGPDKAGFYFEWDYSHQGAEGADVYIYSFNNGSPSCLTTIHSLDGFQFFNADNEYHNESKWRFLENNRNGVYDIEVVTTGNKFNISKKTTYDVNSKHVYGFDGKKFTAVYSGQPPENDLRKFVEWLISIKQVEDLDSIKSCYSAVVNYYGKQITLIDVLKSKKAYFKRWPSLDYQLIDFSVQDTEDPSVTKVTCRIKFFAKNDTKDASGIAESLWEIKTSGKQFLVIGETSRVIERY